MPTLATTTLALAVQDLRRRGVIIRRLSAVEGLAAAKVVCFDKTGTLTLNEMTVVRLYWNNTRARLSGEELRASVVDCEADSGLTRLFELAILCNDADLADVPGTTTMDRPLSSRWFGPRCGRVSTSRRFGRATR